MLRLVRFLRVALEKLHLRLFLFDEHLRGVEGRDGTRRRLVTEIMRHPSAAEVWVRLLRFVGPEEPVFLVDVGAHLGEFTAGALEYWEDARAVALEPAAAAFQRLERRFERDPRVQCLNHAISDRECERELFVNADHPASNSFHRYTGDYKRAFSLKDAGRVENVSCRTLSSAVTLPPRRAVIVKIDTQSHEVSVVEGARRWFLDVDAVLCEVSFYPGNEGLDPSFVHVAAALASQGLYPIAFQSYGRALSSNYAFERNVLFVRRHRLDRILFDREAGREELV